MSIYIVLFSPKFFEILTHPATRRHIVTEENHRVIVSLGETSQLKTDLNIALAGLRTAPESHFQPHLCLNGKDGLPVIAQIAQDPADADTEFWVQSNLVHDGYDRLWLNVCFEVFLSQIRRSTNHVSLSPRQSSYIVQQLPAESQQLVLSAVRSWYTQHFLPEIQEALLSITNQIEGNGLLNAGVHDNNVFDIHDDDETGHEKVPYTEFDVVGEKLALGFNAGFTLFDYGSDWLTRTDRFLEERDSDRRDAVDGVLEFVRGVGVSQ